MKIQKIIIGILIILVVGACIFITFDRSNYLKENKDLKQKIANLNTELEGLKIENNNQNNNKNEDQQCTYTQTYRFIENYDYMGTVPSEKFIVVDAFQEFMPVVLKYNDNEFNIDFEKNSYYEFTFEGRVINGIEIRHIKNIVKTDKTGMEQINESCVIE